MFDVNKIPRTLELELTASGAAQLVYIDERLLPGELYVERTSDWRAVIDAIKTLAVRGAPAIGVAGAAAVTIWACNVGVASARDHGCAEASYRFAEELSAVADEVSDARPTAVNLSWGVERVRSLAMQLLGEGDSIEAVADALYAEVKRMEAEDEAVNRKMGQNGSALFPEHARVLTHCNAGSLATVFYGTALGVVYAAAAEGKIERVYADETRPVGQGSRLTAWELAQAGLPVTLICDNMAASLMAAGKVDLVIVGADRIAANGDVANKIGTYGLAVLAKHHGIPFYVAAPSSTLDPALPSGREIPIEQRAATEVLPSPIDGVEVFNPAFDVTPAELITKIITEVDVFDPCDVIRS